MSRAPKTPQATPSPTLAVVWGDPPQVEWHTTFGEAKARSLDLAAEGYAVTVLEVIGTAYEARAAFTSRVRT